MGIRTRNEEDRVSMPLTTFEEILAPVHQEVRDSGMTEAELEVLLQATLTEVREEKHKDSPDNAGTGETSSTG
jgi:uncharacterized membrane protein